VRIPLPDPPLGDDVVTLRPFGPGDETAVTAACQDPEIPRWTHVPSPYTEGDARAKIASGPGERESGQELALLAVSADGDELLGSCGLNRFDWTARSAEIGYWVAAAARRRGVGSRSTQLLARYGFERLGLARIELLAHPDNEPSQRLAKRAGFTREGVVRSFRERKGVREDYVLFSLLAGELG
jgi:RimJ/RimL family protein N-acetyltransferase